MSIIPADRRLLRRGSGRGAEQSGAALGPSDSATVSAAAADARPGFNRVASLTWPSINRLDARRDSPSFAEPSPTPERAAGRRRPAIPRGRLLRAILAIALIVASAAIYGPYVLYTTSSEAMLNARTITIAAPIDGRVALAPPAEGTAIAAGAPLLTIENTVVDKSQLGDLEAQRTRVAADLAGTKLLIETLEQRIAALADQASDYRQSAVTRLDLVAREAQAELVAAQASATEAHNMLVRRSTLAAAGWVSAADLDRAVEASARADAEVARTQLAAERVGEEAKAARHGVYIADNIDGAPYAQQRTDEFRLRLAEAEAQAAGLAARRAELDDRLAAERERVARLTRAELRAPASGVVWRPDVTAGSVVARDHQVMTLIDCSTLYVTASFASRQFDKLWPGAPATIRVADSGKEYPGTVVDVRAMRDEAGNHFAAPLPTLGAHQVMALLRLDDPGAMASEKYCNVGRQAEVRFGGVATPPVARLTDTTFAGNAN